jgi:hypothetical protein
MSEPIDPTNKFIVCANTEGVVTIAAPPRGPITEADALLLAAWLVAIVADEEKWQATLAAVYGC